MYTMNKFTKKDLLFSIITGLITGIIVWRIFDFLKAPSFGLPTHAWFILIVPVLWIIGVNLGYFLGRWIPLFNQFGKFAAIGFTNAAVYFGILNLLIAYTDIAKGLWYSVFIAVAFIVGTVHSYGWNKYWSFDAGETQAGGVEFIKFLSVSVLAGVINVGIASFVVNGIDPMFGMSAKTWANVGGVVGSGIALVFSFTGFKLAVFKK